MKLNFSMKSLALVSVLGFGFVAPVIADETPLEEEMSVMGKSLKGLRILRTMLRRLKRLLITRRWSVKAM